VWRLEHLDRAVDRSTPVGHRRAEGLPGARRRLERGVVEVAARERGIDDRVPDRVDRRLDVDAVHVTGDGHG
jgi:hypothetical protein